MSIVPYQIELARHALGLPNKRKQSYRNYFVTGKYSPDYAAWDAMVREGYAKKRIKFNLAAGDYVFWLTVLGAEAALSPGEKLDPEDFPETL